MPWIWPATIMVAVVHLLFSTNPSKNREARDVLWRLFLYYLYTDNCVNGNIFYL